MTTEQWHVDEKQLATYAGGTLGGTQACSVEAHVMQCAGCRARLAPKVGHARLEAVWAEVIDITDQPTVSLPERLLRRIGVGAPDARLLTATLSVRLSWFVAVATTLLIAVLAGQSSPQRGLLFLLAAPLLPVVGVALAFGESLDPLCEVARAAPISALRLLLVRCVAVLGPTITMLGPAGFIIESVGLSSAAWLAPSLALILCCLALTTYVSVGYAALSVSGLWFAGALVVQDRHRVGVEGFGATTQLAAVLLAGAAGVLFFYRADRLDLRGGYR